MKLQDTTSAAARKVRRTVLHSQSDQVQFDHLERFKVHIVGLYYTEVGPEWSTRGMPESDYLHHIDLSLAGRRQVVFRGEIMNLEPGMAYWFPGNTPLERRCSERSKVLFLKLRCEWLPGVDPLLDWPGRRPQSIASFDTRFWRGWRELKEEPTINQLLQLQARILDWIALIVLNLDDVIRLHLQTHSQFNGVFDVIEHKLSPRLRIEELARVHGTSLHAFSMAFARNTGMSPKAYIKRRLNQQAMQMLLNTDLKLKEVAERLHFSDEYHFSRFFRTSNGMAPSQYRKALTKLPS